jgi:acyl carrier protein
VTYHPLEPADTERRGGGSIGRRIPDLRLYILDSHGEPVPVGVAGELYIGGAGVARGYWNRPEQTAERFLADPFVADGQARMYKTGDLGRWLPDGNIEFLGRNDFQVKIRGFRIELGEIEAALREQAGVREAVVVAREDAGGDKRLVAYYTSTETSGPEWREGAAEIVGAEVLRDRLSAKLPEYMLPAAYVRIEQFPLTPNGKLDRKALPAPDQDAYGMREYEAPRGETETTLAAIWCEVLKLERVGRRDNFFELGGHSLLAVRVITRVRQALGVEVPLGDLFAKPVLLNFAEKVIDTQLDQFHSTDLAQLRSLM